MTLTPHTPIQRLSPSIIVIFGITGDLASRKLLPALYHLFRDNALNPQTRIIGVSRREVSVEELLGKVELCVNEVDKICDPVALKLMQESLSMVQLEPENDDDYEHLKAYLAELEASFSESAVRLFYLSIPPKSYRPIVAGLGRHGLNADGSRLLVEKPFGSDLTSAEELIQETEAQFSEEQVYRIDHYLAKETAQNILTFRANNPVFSAAWNKDFVESITVVAHEVIGIEGRADFYEGVGALRDIIQSHLLQLLALVTMEMPAKRESDQIHENKRALLDSIRPCDPTQAVRAQYEGYREETQNPDSRTETFARLTVLSEQEAWQGVPMVIETGKALTEKRTDITITFRPVEHHPAHTQLTFRIQPNEGIHVELLVKKPGLDHDIEPAQMDFSYQDSFAQHEQPDAYERVFADAIRGDKSLFTSRQEILSAWRIIQPILDAWEADQNPLPTYEKGSIGPV